MTRLALLLASLALASSACSRARPPPPSYGPAVAESERTLAQGTVRGVNLGEGAHGYLGIPFAHPPVGPLRWRAPRPPQPWSGTFEAVQFGRPCVQLTGPGAGPLRGDDDLVAGSEDCLTLNVFAPRRSKANVPQSERRPVMFWIHGGGNSFGTSATYISLHKFSERHDVIVVSTNYRLGTLGWLRHPALAEDDDTPEERSGNFATLDLVRALHWVRENISAFGGDPQNVTLFGESAGGMNIFALLASPLAKGLFHRAIAMSGLPSSFTPEAAVNFTDETPPGHANSSSEYLARLLQADGTAEDRASAKAHIARMSAEEIRAYLRSRTPRQLIEPFRDSNTELGMYDVAHNIADGVVLPKEPLLAVLGEPGRYNAVPTLLGSNRDEFKLFMVGDERFVSRWFGRIPRIRDDAKYELVARAASDAWRLMGVDAPATKLSAAQPGQVFAYRFDWDNGPDRWVDMSKLLGAAHGVELSIVFDWEKDPFRMASEENAAERRQLGEAMRAYFTEFARTGVPGRGKKGDLPPWPDYRQGHLVLDSGEGTGIRTEQEVVELAAIMNSVLPAGDSRETSGKSCTIAREVFAFLRLTRAWTDEDLDSALAGRCPAPQAKSR